MLPTPHTVWRRSDISVQFTMHRFTCVREVHNWNLRIWPTCGCVSNAGICTQNVSICILDFFWGKPHHRTFSTNGLITTTARQGEANTWRQSYSDFHVVTLGDSHIFPAFERSEPFIGSGKSTKWPLLLEISTYHCKKAVPVFSSS